MSKLGNYVSSLKDPENVPRYDPIRIGPYLVRFRVGEPSQPSRPREESNANEFVRGSGEKGVKEIVIGIDNAVRLIEFLSGDMAQAIYASDNFEYPVKPGVAWHPEVESWGRFKADATDLTDIAGRMPAAVRIIHQGGWR